MYGTPSEPPLVEDLAGEPGVVIEALFARTAGACSLPPVAVREIVENLVHADFHGACVSVLDGGATVRVSDQGPGIDDKSRALRPGFSTADARVREIVRGVGSGFPVATAAMHEVGGALAVDDNLRGGTVVTLTAPGSGASTPARPSELGEVARRALAVLVEVGASTPEALAAELDFSLPICGRELVLLESRGLVSRADDGTYRLTADGERVVSTLF